MSEAEETLKTIGWDVPGWDWADRDYSWLSSKSGIYKDGVSVFFIHGGRVRHQGHIPHGSYGIDEFVAKIRSLAEGLDDPYVEWCSDTGGGDSDLWVEGTRAPNIDDAARLQAARERQERDDHLTLQGIRARNPALLDK